MGKKGQRNERKGSKVYERAGYETWRPPRARGGPTDLFGLFDMAAVAPEAGLLRLVQFKTNGAVGVEAWSEQAHRYATVPGVVVEMAVRYDGEPGPHTPGPKWRLLQPFVDPSVRYEAVFDERDTEYDGGDGLVEYLRGTLP